MTGALVPTRLFRIGRTLNLTKRERPDRYPPAVLVIPRVGPLRVPRLMVLGDRGDGALGPLDFADVHVTALHTCRSWRPRTRHAAEVADVLLDGCPGPPGRLGTLLERYPGCNVAAGAGPCGHAAAIRDADPAGAGFRLFTASGGAGTRALWASIAGSFLYGWAAAGLVPDDLCHAVLIVGGLGVPGRDGAENLVVAGRVQLRPVRRETWREATS